MNIEKNFLLGQIFFISLPTTYIDDTSMKLLKSIQPGGIILFKNNIESIQQLKQLNKEITRLSKIPPFIAIDEEGGSVHRLNKILPPLPSPSIIASKSNPRITEQLHYSLSVILKFFHINFNLYPVVDIPYKNSILNDRCLTADINIMIKYLRNIIHAYKTTKLFYCFKHFPGLGNTTLDSHKDLPTCHLTFKQLWDTDLYPYRKFIKQIPFIMIAHCSYEKITNDKISSLSKDIITNLLKMKLNYKGQILTDDLAMKAVAKNIDIPHACLQAIKAGCHYVTICHSYDDIFNAWQLLNTEITKDKELKKLINKNIKKILSYKRKLTQIQNEPQIKLENFYKNIEILDKINKKLNNPE